MSAENGALRLAAWKGAFPASAFGVGMRLSALMAVALAFSSAALIAILAATGIELHPEFLRFPALALLLVLISVYCDWRKHSWRLNDLAKLLAFVILSLLLCGLVSNTGLRLQMPVADPLLARLDSLLPFDPRDTVSVTASHAWIARGLHSAYNSSSVLCLAAAAWMLAKGARLQLWRFAATAVVAMQITAICSIFFPARGAILHLGLDNLQSDGLPPGAGTYAAESFAHFYSGAEKLVTLGDLSGIVTFPSFHTVLALLIIQGWHATPARWPAVFWGAITLISTIPMGGHYFADLVAGFLVWFVAFKIVERASLRSQ